MTGLNFRHVTLFYRGSVIYQTCAGHIEISILRLMLIGDKNCYFSAVVKCSRCPLLDDVNVNYMATNHCNLPF